MAPTGPHRGREASMLLLFEIFHVLIYGETASWNFTTFAFNHYLKWNLFNRMHTDIVRYWLCYSQDLYKIEE